MSHKVTAVVHNPEVGAGRNVVQTDTELYEFEVNMWYEALDQLIHEIEQRNPHLRRFGVDHLQIKAISMVHVPD